MLLPVEIYRHIVYYVSDKNDLRRLLYTSHVLKAEAERSLLRSIDMNLQHSSLPAVAHARRRRLAQKFEVILRNPELAAAVQELRYRPNAIPEDLIESVFPLLTNLSRLNLTSYHPIFNRCTFRLKFLSINTDDLLTTGVLDFFASQSSVSELFMWSEIAIPLGSLPNLTTLSFFHWQSTRLMVYDEMGDDDLSDRSLESLRVLVLSRLKRDLDWSLLRSLEFLKVTDVRTMLPLYLFTSQNEYRQILKPPVFNSCKNSGNLWSLYYRYTLVPQRTMLLLTPILYLKYVVYFRTIVASNPFRLRNG